MGSSVLYLTKSSAALTKVAQILKAAVSGMHMCMHTDKSTHKQII